MKDCIFCKIIKREIPAKIFYEDKYCIAFLDINPVNIGHTLIIPKTHFETIEQMKKEDLDKLTEAILKISKGI
ncbi:HIT domain-containing protein, partial [Candidatus Woesearchaeota archaeon]|nr:HIT domain-containing protein [Candidatus Woesearchaeota archaeon]